MNLGGYLLRNFLNLDLLSLNLEHLNSYLANKVYALQTYIYILVSLSEVKPV